MKLIVGLGNPGNDYNNTRHNVGFMTVDYLARHLGIDINVKWNNSLYAQTNINGEKVMLLKPLSYINLSGEVISSFIKYFKININDILVINDDLDLPIGSYKLKSHGSSGGHNGLKNIELHLGTDEYKRLKIGISNNKNIDTKDYVLGKFSQDEKEKIDDVVKIAKDILIDFTSLDFVMLMNKYNR
jgi:PTH1 family peptidyl-tRNA hydrolase